MSERPPTGANLSLRVRAEAAAWLAGLRRSNRTSELEDRFRRWLAEGESNRTAWERQSAAWDLAGALLARFEESRSHGLVPRGPEQRARSILAVAAVVSAALVALALARWIADRSGAMSTAVGERRVAVLADGSRITMNTDTRIVVQYDSKVRRVRLVRGEALFDVRKGRRRPFVVVAGTRAIRALGTAFEVRRERGDEVSVTLIDGRISIGPVGQPVGEGVVRPVGQPDGRSNGRPSVRVAGARHPDVTVVDAPGERVTFAPDHAPRVDHPVLRQIIAWQSGDVVFNDTPLPEAAREMNRYSERQISVQGSGLDALHVGGLFQAGESVAFARAVAETFGLEIRESGREIFLSRGTRAPPAAPARRASDAASSAASSSAPRSSGTSSSSRPTSSPDTPSKTSLAR